MRPIRTFRSFWPRAALLSLALVVAVFLSVNIGPDGPLWSLSLSSRLSKLVFWDLRLPRAVLGLLVGAGLAGSGAFVQGVFRNPLATPEILGVSAGASAGAVLFLLLGWGGWSLWGLGLGAWLGALAAAGLVFVWGTHQPGLSGLLLAGLALSSLLSALSSVFLLMGGQLQLSHFLFWLAGSLENRRWEHVFLAAVTILPALTVLTFQAGHLNVASLGDETAVSLGLNLERYRLVNLMVVAFASAGCVATAGAIGFIGLMIPHAVRLLWGEDYRFFIPLSVLSGGLFLSLADTAVRLLPWSIPVGLLTALLGAPLFLVLVRTQVRGRP